MSKKDKSKQESLDRLKNQLYQAQINGDTSLAKKIKAIIERVDAKK